MGRQGIMPMCCVYRWFQKINKVFLTFIFSLFFLNSFAQIISNSEQEWNVKILLKINKLHIKSMTEKCYINETKGAFNHYYEYYNDTMFCSEVQRISSKGKINFQARYLYYLKDNKIVKISHYSKKDELVVDELFEYKDNKLVYRSSCDYETLWGSCIFDIIYEINDSTKVIVTNEKYSWIYTYYYTNYSPQLIEELVIKADGNNLDHSLSDGRELRKSELGKFNLDSIKKTKKYRYFLTKIQLTKDDIIYENPVDEEIKVIHIDKVNLDIEEETEILKGLVGKKVYHLFILNKDDLMLWDVIMEENKILREERYFYVYP